MKATHLMMHLPLPYQQPSTVPKSKIVAIRQFKNATIEFKSIQFWRTNS